MAPDDLPLVVRVMRDYKAALLEREEAQMGDMAGRWWEVERALQGAIERLAGEMLRLRENGEEVSAGKLLQLGRYQALLDQVRVELSRYEGFCDALIEGEMHVYGRLGVEHSSEAVRAAFMQAGEAAPSFNVLSGQAVETMAGFTANGAPLRRLLSGVQAGAVEGLRQALVRSAALGRNPRVTAGELMRLANQGMRDGLALGLNRALCIARTEQLRTYREATLANYRATGLVRGYKRLCAHDQRVCAACLFDEGAFYGLDMPFVEHPNGRCTSVPVVRGLAEVRWLGNEEWFVRQEEGVQRAILGGRYFDAWRAGRFGLRQLVAFVEDATWGRSLRVRALGEV